MRQHIMSGNVLIDFDLTDYEFLGPDNESGQLVTSEGFNFRANTTETDWNALGIIEPSDPYYGQWASNDSTMLGLFGGWTSPDNIVLDLIIESEDNSNFTLHSFDVGEYRATANALMVVGFLNGGETISKVIDYDNLFGMQLVEFGPEWTNLERVEMAGLTYGDAATQVDFTLDNILLSQSSNDPITGFFNGPGTVNLKNKGVTPFALFGSEEINVEAIKVDSLVFGGVGSGIGVAQKKNDSFFASYEDVNEDGELDLVVKVETNAFANAFAGVAPTEPFEVFGSLNDGTEVVFGLNEGDSINFI